MGARFDFVMRGRRVDSYYHGYGLFSHVQKVPLSAGVLLSMTDMHDSTLSAGLIWPSTSHPSSTLAISVFTSPG